jgi:hypothetical protein
MKQKRGPKWLFCGFSVVFGMFAVMALFIMASGERVLETHKVQAAVGFATACAILSGSFLVAYAVLEVAAAVRGNGKSGEDEKKD